MKLLDYYSGIVQVGGKQFRDAETAKTMMELGRDFEGVVELAEEPWRWWPHTAKQREWLIMMCRALLPKATPLVYYGRPKLGRQSDFSGPAHVVLVAVNRPDHADFDHMVVFPEAHRALLAECLHDYSRRRWRGHQFWAMINAPSVNWETEYETVADLIDRKCPGIDQWVVRLPKTGG